MGKQNPKNILMTETTFYILLSLTRSIHGYAAMKKVKELSDGTVTIGAGTLYGAFSKLQAEGLIRIVKEDSRRKLYQLTPEGLKSLINQISNLEFMVEKGQGVLAGLVEAVERKNDGQK